MNGGELQLVAVLHLSLVQNLTMDGFCICWGWTMPIGKIKKQTRAAGFAR